VIFEKGYEFESGRMIKQGAGLFPDKKYAEMKELDG
jgi:hypothetical protein